MLSATGIEYQLLHLQMRKAGLDAPAVQGQQVAHIDLAAKSKGQGGGATNHNQDQGNVSRPGCEHQLGFEMGCSTTKNKDPMPK